MKRDLLTHQYKDLQKSVEEYENQPSTETDSNSKIRKNEEN